MQIKFESPNEFVDMLNEISGPTEALKKENKNLGEILQQERNQKHEAWEELNETKANLASTEDELEAAKKFIDEFEQSLVARDNKLSLLKEKLEIQEGKKPVGEKAFLLHGNLFRMSRTNGKYYGWNKGCHQRIYYTASALSKNPDAYMVYLNFGDSREN